ncbi:phospholipid/cholesterol/gamma-HCH transport system substrate-binding protein [Thermomonospora echinospora]|uniref:Phospholipid/cholesterol/gamma-HCH transport system substrate-binding protein n=1 Tax=Thermomonospora echinospora TaxID=1992 RepID=A0A1H6D9E6_9ACTN|nr:MlaD family protein [Thermomonospora echinospora]SEG81453.1 phospholipid/cholesterol/gamma-HCH transport system substrate-binding protein [Thermomonospora echinospora]
MNQALSPGRRVAVVLLTALVLAAAGHLLIARPFAADGTRLTADFAGAGQSLTTASPVKLRGVTVGRISRIELAPDGGARLTLRIDHGVRIPDTVTASLEPESVFGPKFLNLLPGPHEATGPFLADGAHIARTSESLDLTSMLGDAEAVLAAIDPQDVAVIVDALGQGLGSSGPNLAGLVRQTGTLVDVAHRQRGRARTMLSDLARLARLRGVGADLSTTAASSVALLDTLTAGPRGRGLRTAQGVSEITSLLARGLSGYEGDLRATFHSMEGAATFLHAQLPLAGPGVRRVVELMPVYQAMAWVPGPQNKRLLAINVLLPTSPCQLLVGVCPPASGGR